jgi:hypothetical protein
VRGGRKKSDSLLNFNRLILRVYNPERGVNREQQRPDYMDRGAAFATAAVVGFSSYSFPFSKIPFPIELYMVL